MAAPRMYYKIDRTYLTSKAGESEQQHDKTPYLVPAATAAAAALMFVSNEKARLLSGVTSFPGDKATATAWVEGRMYVIFVQRGVEAIDTRRRPDLDDSTNRKSP